MIFSTNIQSAALFVRKQLPSQHFLVLCWYANTGSQGTSADKRARSRDQSRRNSVLAATMSQVSGNEPEHFSLDPAASQESLCDDSKRVRHNFRLYCCYLLQSRPYPARSYIGFTVDPARRIKQHNGDISTGGAYRTTKNRPWDVLAIVHGFISSTQAMQFEWAWQNPDRTKALKLHPQQDGNIFACSQSPYRTTGQRVSALAALLSVPPWSRCPLTVTVPSSKSVWEKIVKKVVFPSWARIDFRPMRAIATLSKYDYGSIEVVPGRNLTGSCAICSASTNVRRGTFCVACGVTFHLHCVASSGKFRYPSESCDTGATSCLIPNKIICPRCRRDIQWSEIVRFAHVVTQAKLHTARENNTE